MEWVNDFYSTTGRWWGPAEASIAARDLERVHVLTDVCGKPPSTVLELGSGYGTTAAATANAGFTVTAIELSDRAAFAERFVNEDRAGQLTLVRGDFYVAELNGPYDVVTYWNGFGIGDDADQRRLLRRIADEWLAEGGVALIDVGNPFVRASWNGDDEYRQARPEAGYEFSLHERTEYDPVHNRFIDTWWEDGAEDEGISQTLRCYTPADLTLLLEGTGLHLRAVFAGGQSIDLASPQGGNAELLTNHQEYLAVLERP